MIFAFSEAVGFSLSSVAMVTLSLPLYYRVIDLGTTPNH